MQGAAALQEKELSRRLRLYRPGRPFPDVAGRVVVLVDDGAATGTSVRAALAALRQHRPARVVVALPVAARDTATGLASEIDDLVCLQRPADFRAVGDYYDDFSQVDDQEALAILEGARQAAAAG
jgi:putative phosphoribosyl transferase